MLKKVEMPSEASLPNITSEPQGLIAPISNVMIIRKDVWYTPEAPQFTSHQSNRHSVAVPFGDDKYLRWSPIRRFRSLFSSPARVIPFHNPDVEDRKYGSSSLSPRNGSLRSSIGIPGIGWNSQSVPLRIGVLFTPDKDALVFDYNKSLGRVLFGNRVGSLILAFNKRFFGMANFLNLLGCVLLCIDILGKIKDTNVPVRVVYGVALFTELMTFFLINRDNFMHGFRSFEVAYSFINVTVLCSTLIDYLDSSNSWRIFALLFLYAEATRMVCIDAKPISFLRFNNNLQLLHEDIMNEKEVDPGICMEVANMALLIRAKMSHPSIPEKLPIRDEAMHGLCHPAFYQRSTSFISLVKSKWKLLMLFSHGVALHFAITLTATLVTWMCVEYSPVDQTRPRVIVFFGEWSTLGVIRATTINFVVIQLRRLIAHIIDPTRSFCYDRKVVKMPVVQALEAMNSG